VTHPLRGSFIVLVLFDVAEQIRLDQLRALIGAQQPRQPAFKHPTPEYVRFERPPVIEYPAPVALPSGERFNCRIKYFDYGVVSVELELGFEADWDQLVRLSSRWISEPAIEKCTSDLVTARLAQVKPSLEQPYDSMLSEDYYVIHLKEAVDADGRAIPAPEMLASRGPQLAQIVRGELLPLAETERAEALQASMSYYPSDLLVVGWIAALVYDTAEGGVPAIELLEYANTQLLEFRHYHEGGLLRPWKLAREANRLNAMRLDVTELTERMDNSIKFLSDMFYARAYRVAAVKVGVTDYRTLVERKLRTAGELYESMVNSFHQARSFLLEVMVVAILVIELIHLFRGGL
jgi:hypothetical protein